MIDYYERLNLAIDFIERNLRAPIRVADVSTAAFQSQWHFQRVFRFMTGHSVAEYLRRRRLAEAGHALLKSGARVLDVALEFGYESSEAFSRAFRKEIGVNPAGLRGLTEFPYFERIDIYGPRFQDVYPNVAIEERVVIRNATVVRGIRKRTSMRHNRQFQDIPTLWGRYFAERLPEKIPEQALPGTTIGVYSNWDFEENFDLTIGAPVARDAATDLSLANVEIPAGKFTVFTIPGSAPEDLIAGWKYIYGTWMPNTRNEREFGVDFDLFDERFTNGPAALSEIYIPIK
ncbi:MAG: AraC family transcriptional regulator [Leptospirales bacterium]